MGTRNYIVPVGQAANRRSDQGSGSFCDLGATFATFAVKSFERPRNSPADFLRLLIAARNL
jgi:hypothetical protein